MSKESFILIVLALDSSEVSYLLISIGYIFSHPFVIYISTFVLCQSQCFVCFVPCQILYYIVHFVLMKKNKSLNLYIKN